MPAGSTVFPAFIRDEYQPGTGFAQFERSAQAAAEGARRSFEGSFSEIQRLAASALSMPRNQLGSLDLNVGQYRQAAVEAQAHAAALREVAVAAERAAIASGDTSEATRLYVQAARAASIEAEGTARSATQQVTAMERLQRELNQTQSSTNTVIATNRRYANSIDEVARASRVARFASVQMGQQLQDVAIQMQAGTSAMTILVQQGTQLGFAMSQMTGRMQAVGRFLSGPWGTAIFLGVAAIGYLTQALNRSKEAAEEVEEANSGLAQAQGALGEMFDLVTGKLERQNEVLLINARLQAVQLEAEALREREAARQTFEALGSRGIGARGSLFARGVNEGRTLPEINRLQQQADEYTRQIQGMLSQIAAAGTEEQRRAAEARALDLANSINFDILNVTREEYLQAIVDRASSTAKEDIARRIRESLDSGTLDPGLRREGRARRPREDRRPEQAEAAIERIQRITEQYDEQARIVDRASQAMRELDAILAEARQRGLPRFDEMAAGAERARVAIRDGLIREISEGFEDQPRLIDRATEALEALNSAASQLGGDQSFLASLERARTVVVDALNRPYREFLQDQVRSYEVGQLVAQGRDEEAEALQIIVGLEAQLGPLGEERRQVILDSVIALREQARELEIIRDRQRAFLSAIDDVRGSVTDVIADPSSAGSFLSNLRGAYNRLNAEFLTERLFGNMFRELEDFATGRDRIRAANEEMAATIGGARAEIANLATAQRDQVQSVDEVIAATDRLTQAFDGAAARVTGAAAAATAATSTPRLGAPTGRWPVDGRVTDSFTEHLQRGSAGVDIAAAAGTAIRAPAGGRVVTIGYDARSGHHVVIDHGGRIVSSYSHLIRRPNLTEGQTIASGAQIGQVGSTGRSSGNHVHWRVRVNGEDVNPLAFRFPAQAAEAAGAAEQLGTGLRDLQEVVNSLSDAVPEATQKIKDAGDAAEQEIEVVGDPTRVQGSMNPRDLFSRMFSELSNRVFGARSAKIIGEQIAIGMQGAAIGQQVAPMFTGAFGIRGSNMGAGLGGALGNMLGEQLAPMLGKQLGQFAGPIGSIAGSILGSVIGGAFKSTPRASTTIVGTGGQLSIAGTTGTAGLRGQTASAADSVIAMTQRIAEAFGGSLIGGAGSVSLGMRNGSYRVDTTGKGVTKTSKGALDFGEDAEAAVRAAVLDLIQDGVIAGLRAGTQRLLQNSKDLDTGIDKALKFEGVFIALKERLDPVGAAMDAVNKKFAGLRQIFAEAGASAEELADLEKLYSLEREEAIKEAGERMTSALRSLLDDLTVNNDALSLRDRLSFAQAKYNPLAADIAAGKTVDYDAFADAARTVLDIQRQISGSTSPYFELLDQVTALTRKALEGQENLVSIATGATPAGAAPPSETEPVVGAIDRLGGLLVDELGGQLTAVNDNLGTLIHKMYGSGGGGGNNFADFDSRANF